MKVEDMKRNGLAALVALIAILVIAGPASAEKRYFEMTIDTVTIDVHPTLTYTTFGFNGQVPGPLIHIKEGDDVTVKVTNRTAFPHTVHWHGIYQTNNWQNDGVPNVTQPNIDPGQSFTYHFVANPAGSLWYHCHVNVNEHVAFRGMWGPMIVDPKEESALEKSVTIDTIMMFSSYASSWAEKPGFGGMPDDIIDYFAINGRSFPNSQPVRLKKGDVLRMRLYGAGGETHSFHTHGHSFLVVRKDGWLLPQPYRADTIMVGPGERYDIIMKADNPGRFIVHDHVDIHVTARGKYPAGPITIFEYEGIQRDDDWYAWKDKVYDPNYYFQESLASGKYGLFESKGHKGVPLKRKRSHSGGGHK